MKHQTRALLVALLLLAGLAWAAGPATASSKPTYYLSLGDSVATSYQPIGGDKSGYTEAVYKAIRDDYDQLEHVKLGCNGETTASMIDTGLAGFCRYAGNQLDVAAEFLAAHPGQVALITIDIGGNDVLACLNQATFLLDQGCLDQAFPATLANLATILNTLQTAAPGVPIVGSDYADVFLGLWVFGPGGQAAAAADAPIVDALNADLVATYQAAGVPVADVSGAFDSDNFTDTVNTKQWGTIPVNVANICRWTWFCDDKYTFDVHANSDGHQIIANAFLETLP